MSINKSDDKVFIVADYFIAKNNRDKKGLSNKKLQKLLYYSQAWSLVNYKKKLFDDKIEAWVHGPAIKKVYLKYRQFGYSDILAQIDENEFKTLTQEETELLDAVWDVYGKYDANYLEMLTHAESPWQEARRDVEKYESSSNEISPRLMQIFYGKRQKEAKSST